jgi:hypothetical protein
MADPEGLRRPDGIKLAEPERCTDSCLISAVCRLEFKPGASLARE